jgi:hypothetical protein
MFKRKPALGARTPAEAELAAFADGSLSSERRRAVAEQVAASPELQAIVAEQAAAIGLIRGASAAAPPSIHRAFAPARPRPAPRWHFGLVAATAAAMAAVAVLLVSVGGGGNRATVAEAAVFATHPATMAPPAEDRSRPAFLRQAVEGVAYPDWTDHFHLIAVGQRSDRLTGHDAVTVFYANRSAGQIGYTIVSGPALPLTQPAQTIVSRGVTFRALQAGGRTVVTWQRDGHTCILSSARAGSSQLVQLASSTARVIPSYNPPAAASPAAA